MRPRTPSGVETSQTTVIAEVMRHAVVEEMIAYPAIEEYVPNGTTEVEHDKAEHDQIVQVMKRMNDARHAGADASEELADRA